MGAVWSALLVGGGLAGALFVWLLRGPGKDGGAEPEEDAPAEEAVAAGGDGAGGAPNPGPCKRELAAKPEYLQGGNGCSISDTKEPGKLQEARWPLKSPGEDRNCEDSREHVPLGWLLDTGCLTASEARNSRGCSEVSRNESHESSIGQWGFQKAQETFGKAVPTFTEKLPSSNLFMDKVEEISLARMDSQELADSEDWEMVSRHSSWGDVGLDGSIEFSMLSSNQGLDNGRSSLVEARGQEVDMKTKRAVATSSKSQQVSIRFQIHYITSTAVQFVAVIGDHETLGRWDTYIPLQHTKDGLWSRSVFLPADTVVEWKFVVVENGDVVRWEECSNRLLDTGHKDKVVHKSWGIH